jgi:hypothetical protein
MPCRSVKSWLFIKNAVRRSNVAVYTLLRLFHLEDGSTNFFRNVGNYRRADTASHPRRLKLWATPLGEPRPFQEFRGINLRIANVAYPSLMLCDNDGFITPVLHWTLTYTWYMRLFGNCLFFVSSVVDASSCDVVRVETEKELCPQANSRGNRDGIMKSLDGECIRFVLDRQIDSKLILYSLGWQ